jgi:hypothetical protein
VRYGAELCKRVLAEVEAGVGGAGLANDCQDNPSVALAAPKQRATQVKPAFHNLTGQRCGDQQQRANTSMMMYYACACMQTGKCKCGNSAMVLCMPSTCMQGMP